MIERNGYYKTFGKHPGPIRKMLMDGTASEMIPSLQIYGQRHLFRLGKEVLIMMFTGYHFRWNHPLKLDMERQISGMTEAGITYHIREK